MINCTNEYNSICMILPEHRQVDWLFWQQ